MWKMRRRMENSGKGFITVCVTYHQAHNLNLNNDSGVNWFLDYQLSHSLPQTDQVCQNHTFHMQKSAVNKPKKSVKDGIICFNFFFRLIRWIINVRRVTLQWKVPQNLHYLHLFHPENELSKRDQFAMFAHKMAEPSGDSRQSPPRSQKFGPTFLIFNRFRWLESQNWCEGFTQWFIIESGSICNRAEYVHYDGQTTNRFKWSAVVTAIDTRDVTRTEVKYSYWLTSPSAIQLHDSYLNNNHKWKMYVSNFECRVCTIHPAMERCEYFSVI